MVDHFEATLHMDQTRTRQRSPVLGPKRKSVFSRAQAVTQSESIVAAHNRKQRAGQSTYTMALNELSDLSDEEYRSFLKSRPEAVGSSATNKRGHSHHHHHNGAPHAKDATSSGEADSLVAATVVASAKSAIPTEVNWLTKESGKYVTPIKNQGTCGSCWAFSGLAVTESRYAIENNVTASPLSVEQVLSCSASLDHIRSKFAKDMISSSEGCDGGMPFLTYEYMSRMAPYGVACASNYPYVMATTAGETLCQTLSTSDVAVTWKNSSSSYVAVDSSNEEALLRAVMTGPVSANLDATGDGFKLYSSGIYDAKDCSSDGKEVNHAVVVAGFGETEAGEKYWIIRNTWGTMWGEDGNMRIARGSSVSGPCNLYLYSSYPVNLFASAAATTASKSNAGGATCALPENKFEKLPMGQVIGFDVLQALLLLGSCILAVGAGMAYFWVTERRLNTKAASGYAKYEDSYRRWMLPSREQLLANLAGRQHAQV
ncbi:hypothetical protein Gpo141_00000681 [Globisporangium polare]